MIECETDHRVHLTTQVYITVDQFVLLEYAALTDVMKKHRNGREMTEVEKKLIINYEYQQEAWMEKGFISQGHALYEFRSEEKSEDRLR